VAGSAGSCGQMDIQCHGPGRAGGREHQEAVRRYDREGKDRGFGKAARRPNRPASAGAANPMNVRACGTGDVYTAERRASSSGFKPVGEFLETGAGEAHRRVARTSAVGVSATPASCTSSTSGVEVPHPGKESRSNFRGERPREPAGWVCRSQPPHDQL